MSTALRFLSTARSTCTDVSASGWQSGMRSGVRLAPMMPARRATDSTSPFFTPPPVMRAIVSGCMRTEPLAVAVRSVTALAVTSTMAALPLASKWVRRGMRVSETRSHPIRFASRPMRRPTVLGERERVGRGCEQPGGGHIGLTHERLADEEDAGADLVQAREVGGRIETALGDEQAIRGHAWGERLGDRQIDLERLQVAVVDADEPRLQLQSARSSSVAS